MDSLRQLHGQITSSTTIADHHKLSVLYYLLLDIDGAKANEFADNAGLPSKYRTLMQGLWYLDRLDFSAALQELTHPSLLPEFADDIITALVRHAKDGDYTLPLAYWHTVQPVLKSSTALGLLFEALAKSDVAEALRFTRARPESMRELLFQRLISMTLEGARNEESAERACELAALPFNAQEEAWFQEYLTNGEGKRLKGARDTLLMRRVAMGDTAIGGEHGTWGVVTEAFKAGGGGRV